MCRVLEQKPEGQANQLAITPALPPSPLQWPLAVPRMQGAITPAVPPAPSQWQYLGYKEPVDQWHFKDAPSVTVAFRR